MNEIIRIENLTHTYGEGTPFRRSAVENLSLDIYRGEFLGLIGHTGSGKSTLIQHLNGLLKPTGGRVLLDGEDIWADPKKIRSVRFRSVAGDNRTVINLRILYASGCRSDADTSHRGHGRHRGLQLHLQFHDEFRWFHHAW